jgi:hypothetical protein
MNEDQEDQYAELVGKIEESLQRMATRGGSSNAILGLLMKLSMIAIHPKLGRGIEYKDALTAVHPEDYAAPKLLACAERIAASPGCGHIVFCEPTAVHQWLREVLVAKGIPRERIAIVNSPAAKPADRNRIANLFNGRKAEPPTPGACGSGTVQRVPATYDVIIANSVANEGLDLQDRTCAIHHLDLPWTSSDLEQRNGRGVRQGNENSVVQIFYYMSERSMDWYRYQLIQGKRAWLSALLESQTRDTSNPGAQKSLSDEEILLMISRDPEATKRAIDARREASAPRLAAPSHARRAACSSRRAPGSATPATRRTPSKRPACAPRARIASGLAARRHRRVAVGQVDRAGARSSTWCRARVGAGVRGAPRRPSPVNRPRRAAHDVPRVWPHRRDPGQSARRSASATSARRPGSWSARTTSGPAAPALRAGCRRTGRPRRSRTSGTCSRITSGAPSCRAASSRTSSGKGRATRGFRAGGRGSSGRSARASCARVAARPRRSRSETPPRARSIRPAGRQARARAPAELLRGEVLAPTLAGWRQFLKLAPDSAEQVRRCARSRSLVAAEAAAWSAEGASPTSPRSRATSAPRTRLKRARIQRPP